MKIQDLRAREIIDCKGKPLLEVDIITEDGTMGRAASPSGISAGEHEAMVLRDGDRSRYDGNGVRKAVEMAEKVVLPAIRGMDVLDQQALDRRLMELDGTPNKSRLGGNVTYSASLAVMRAGCQLRHVSQYRYLNPGDIRTIPLPTSDMFAGGSYEDDTMPVQETTIVPYKASSIAEATEILCKVYKKLPEVIREFQGGRRPEIGAMSEYMAPSTDFMDCLDILYETAKRCHCEEKIAFHMDCAFSEIYDAKRGTYHYCGREVDLDEIIGILKQATEKYNFLYIEDPVDENDWEGWALLTKTLGSRVQLVGDDLFVTNTQRLKTGIEKGVANAILIKVNQIGTLTETLDAIQMANRAGYTAVVSHRSGETEDTTIADLAVALNAGQIKTGAPSRTDRVAKYNQLLRIEEELDDVAQYLGKDAFFNLK